MRLDYNQLIKLLNLFGISLKINDDKVNFIDRETNLPMESYLVNRGYRINTDKVADLFSGYLFYVRGVKNFFKINISFRYGRLAAYKIEKTKEIEPHLYEATSFRSDMNNIFEVEEEIFRNPTDEQGVEYLDHNVEYYAKFNAEEISTTHGGMRIKKEKEWAYTWLQEDAETGEFINEENYYDEISKQEFISLIDQSRVFKDIMNILCPKLTQHYTNIKSECVKVIS